MPNAHADVVKVLPYNCAMHTGYHKISFKKLSICLSFFLLANVTQSQYSYNYKPVRDISILGGSSITFGVSWLMQKQVEPLDIVTINALKINDINRFDRIACRYWNKDIALASDVVAIGSVALPVWFYINGNTRKDAFKIGNVAAESLMLSQALANLFKLGKRNRPYLYNSETPMSQKLKSDSRMSFFSAHTTTVSSMCFSFAFAHGTYFKDSKSNGIIMSSAIILPAIEGFMRVRAGKHFPSDVITGYLVGLGSAYLMHRIHLVRK